MRTVAFINLKGGVGKTVSAANVAHILATVHHKKVLLVDADKQGSASRYFRVYGEHDGTAALLLADALDTESVERTIYRTGYNGLDIITSGMELYAADRALYDRDNTDTARVLFGVLDWVHNDYDYTSTTNTVPAGSATIMYRVKAYDSEGLYSSYRNSAQVSVFNNTAPGAPGGITVPENVLGGAALTVTWSAASDVDGNLTGYELERQVNGGEWAQVYKGADTSYTDTITRGWASVNYRVRAYDAYNAYSGYVTGTAQPVNNNRAPAITCGTASGTDLGKKDAGFSITYSVGDEDGDSVTVTEAIDGVVLRTFSANLGGNNTFAVTGDTFFKLLNGTHTLTITASDGQASAVHTLNFTKEITEAGITLKEPFGADGKITICVLSVAGDIPADAEYKVEVTNNANDDAPVWEDCTMEVKNGGNHIFENETAAKGFAFNFRVSVKRGPSGQGGYISSVQGGFQ